ncbi:MAG: tRNA preQ1(34) S-adenosylmethionine ribosyltransferase-isomerase QueA [Bryobacteraceae bacterium]|nr:tRNA preQ1(34) S-adenosylmethionine ribosyltransferase-isomerase QueA [Bryobacteraceae bacterium]
MLVLDFDYKLPEDLIAQEPLPDRAASRMLVVHSGTQHWEDRLFREIPRYLQPGDCLILNNSRVFPSRLFGTRSSGTARVEVFLIRPLEGDSRTWQALVRPGRKLPVGERISFSPSLACQVLDRGDHGERTIRFEGDIDLYAELDQCGHTPLPPYIRRADREEDRTRYNTVFAATPGSVAAPTAGLHFTTEVLNEIRAAGARIAFVTLHVGLGTFAPIYVETVAEVKLHPERFCIEPEQWEIIRSARRRIAVGTTAARTVETAYARGELSGETNLFLAPGYRFQGINGLLTNFHLPQSSLIMLVSALAGHNVTMSAYRHAVDQRYRFFSYGDCMLILP